MAAGGAVAAARGLVDYKTKKKRGLSVLRQRKRINSMLEDLQMLNGMGLGAKGESLGSKFGGGGGRNGALLGMGKSYDRLKEKSQHRQNKTNDANSREKDRTSGSNNKVIHTDDDEEKEEEEEEEDDDTSSLNSEDCRDLEQL